MIKLFKSIFRPRCSCADRLQQRALQAFDDAYKAERVCDHRGKRANRIIGRSCLLANDFLRGAEDRGHPLIPTMTNGSRK